MAPEEGASATGPGYVGRVWHPYGESNVFSRDVRSGAVASRRTGNDGYPGCRLGKEGGETASISSGAKLRGSSCAW